MFGFNAQAKNNAALLKALDKSLAIIEFDAKGTVLTANANFCRLLGYAPEEIVGKHHSIFVDADYARSAEYRSSGKSSAAANSTPANTSGSARAARGVDPGVLQSCAQFQGRGAPRRQGRHRHHCRKA